MPITWNYIDDSFDTKNFEGCPKKSGWYLGACGAGYTLPLYWNASEKTWSEVGYESEGGGWMKEHPYAWAELPKAPARK